LVVTPGKPITVAELQLQGVSGRENEDEIDNRVIAKIPKILFTK